MRLSGVGLLAWGSADPLILRKKRRSIKKVEECPGMEHWAWAPSQPWAGTATVWWLQEEGRGLSLLWLPQQTRTVTTHRSGGCESSSEMPVGLVSPCPRVAPSLCTRTPGISSFSHKDTSPMGIGPTLMTSLNLNYVLQGPGLNMVTLGG